MSRATMAKQDVKTFVGLSSAHPPRDPRREAFHACFTDRELRFKDGHSLGQSPRLGKYRAEFKPGAWAHQVGVEGPASPEGSGRPGS